MLQLKEKDLNQRKLKFKVPVNLSILKLTYRIMPPPPLLSALPVASQAQSIKNEPKSEKDEMHLPATNLSDLSSGVIKSEVGRTTPIMNAPAKPYFAQYISPASTPPQAEPLAQYLARRDLVSSGLYQFDDKPENYWSWYSSFTSAAREVHLTATQELDLMTKWLGKESGETVKRIRSVHVSNPNLALPKAWERLRECYATWVKGHCFSD